MSVYEMAKHYFRDFTPPLWDKSRLAALVKAGKLTEEEADEIIEGDESE